MKYVHSELCNIHVLTCQELTYLTRNKLGVAFCTVMVRLLIFN